ncbi:calmodulin-binding transcription activator 2-like protein isoform X1 [Tanacetum coccineum]|uniref:Calmodulin-binding transcription activator 2-like protein isoform X1 n=1 Tax=Tanacetum coccineum TaxID=301880 RepID=A0ABQ5GRA3_9ASTR
MPDALGVILTYRSTFLADFLSHKLTDARLDVDSRSQDFFSYGNGLFLAAEQLRVGTEAIYASKNGEAGGELKKLDNFGRWMDKEMGGDCEDSLMASNSGNYWDALENEKDQTEVSSLSHHIQLNTDLVGPSLANKRLFKVAAEFVTGNVIRCQVPLCGAGCVPFYITCNNRIACSEVREFEYVQKPSTIAAANATCVEEEFGLLIRLSKLLSSGAERKWSGSVVNCEKCKLKDLFHSLIDDKEGCWKRITELLYEAHEGCQGLRMLDERGQGIIHLAAALGYEWAISPVVAAGMSPCFRDAHGRTALHCTLQYITLCLVVFDASAIQGLFI